MNMPMDYVTKESCESIHKGTVGSIDKLTEKVGELSNRLYKDNGHLSIQTRLDRQERFFGLVSWVLGVVGTTLLIQFILIGIAIVKYVIKLGAVP